MQECIQKDPIPFPQEPTIEEQEISTSSPPLPLQSNDNDKTKMEEDDENENENVIDHPKHPQTTTIIITQPSNTNNTNSDEVWTK